MPITFKTKTYADITMLNEVGKEILKMMDFGDRVPGAIAAKDVEQALSNLQKSLSVESNQKELDTEDGEEEPKIALSTRALPLCKLLQSAIAGDDNVSWA
ncbi:MAG: hypothetical protein ACI9JR_000141 [Gammaproteobacteria bacterium]|jgi:hypothetical protein